MAASRGRLVMADAHARLAFFVVRSVALNLASALRPWHLLRLEPRGVVPFEVTHGSRALMLLAGWASCGRARPLPPQACRVAARDRHDGLSVLLHLGHHASILRAGVSLVLLVELARNGHRFRARSDPLRLRHALIAHPRWLWRSPPSAAWVCSSSAKPT